jgi:hypothetical protein
LLEDHEVHMIVLDHEIDVTEEYLDNMGFIDEMGGSRYSNVAANIEKHGFQAISMDALGQKLKENQVVIPF